MTMTIGAVLLAAAVVVFLIHPLVAGLQAPLDKSDDEVSEAEATRRVKLLALRDVEYDFQSGKLDETDYRSLKRELSAEALTALEESEREALGVGRDSLEAEIAAVREGLASGATCASCGHLNPEASRFCSSCGGSLGASADAGVGGGDPT